MKHIQQYYPSNIIGSKIRNAITGESSDDSYVGSLSENNFFRVIDSSGKYDSNGISCPYNPNSNKLFFKSYDEFKQFYKLHQPGGYEYLKDEENE
tara:strand:+ start:258 stop:542 length:285 start_codon:yes stop_codon:yes gene_type:complete